MHLRCFSVRMPSQAAYTRPAKSADLGETNSSQSFIPAANVVGPIFLKTALYSDAAMISTALDLAYFGTSILPLLPTCRDQDNSLICMNRLKACTFRLTRIELFSSPILAFCQRSFENQGNNVMEPHRHVSPCQNY